MQLGIAIKDTWGFFDEIYSELATYHHVSVYNPPNVSPPFFKKRFENYLKQRNMRKFLQDHDVVFFEWASSLLVTATQQPKVCGIVTRLHRYELYEYADDVNWDAVDKIILVSNAKRSEFSERFPKQVEKIVVVPEGVSVNKFPLRTKTYTGDIGTLCHITPRKRVYELILGFNELLQKNDHFRLHIGGGKRIKFLDYYEAVHDLVDRLNINDKVILYEHIDNPTEWYSKIDIFISNSYSEGLQVSPIEAMASGCFCISHKWPGAEELLPQENLFFTNSEMISLITRYSESTEAEKNHQKEYMRQLVCRNFNLDNIKLQIRKIVEEVNESKIKTDAA
jgi:glycosyltransferase involved in cell wall biosynthesis